MENFSQRYTPSLAPRFLNLLKTREQEMRELLRTSGHLPSSTEDRGGREVNDFKDIAGEESQVAVDEAQAAHALHELIELAAARKRMESGTYGQCTECGDAIDMRRLAAMPATAHCASCQAAVERVEAIEARR